MVDWMGDGSSFKEKFSAAYKSSNAVLKNQIQVAHEIELLAFHKKEISGTIYYNFISNFVFSIIYSISPPFFLVSTYSGRYIIHL